MVLECSIFGAVKLQYLLTKPLLYDIVLNLIIASFGRIIAQLDLSVVASHTLSQVLDLPLAPFSSS